MTAERHKRHWSSPANDDPISWQLLRFLNRFPLPEMKAASFRCFQSWDFVAILTLGLKPLQARKDRDITLHKALLLLCFISRAGGRKHTTPGSMTHDSCSEMSKCFRVRYRGKHKGKVLMCLFQTGKCGEA